MKVCTVMKHSGGKYPTVALVRRVATMGLPHSREEVPPELSVNLEEKKTPQKCNVCFIRS